MGAMRLAPALLCACSLATAGCGDDDDHTGHIDAAVGAPDAAATADGPSGPDATIASADAAPPDGAIADAPPVVTSDAGPAAFSFSGPVTGPGSPAEGVVVVFWVVSASSPDYGYKFGDGVSTGVAYVAGLPTDPPPPEALNAGIFGVGFAVLMPPGTEIAQGIYYDEGVLAPMIGFSARHAIIYKAMDSGAIGWLAAFPVGYACGVCVTNPSGFDSYAPTSCDTVEITTDMTVESCNWT